MKTTARLLLALTLGLALALSPLFALTKQVTTVGATASTIFTPGQFCQWVSISNTGSGDVMLSFDGSTDPTATVGYPLAHGGSICVVYAGTGQKFKIRAILQTGTTTTLNVVTPDTTSS